MLQIKSILLDIEGTTTPISFVYNTLFPYAKKRMSEFLSSTIEQDLEADILALQSQYQKDLLEKPTLEKESILNYIYWLMDRDVKSTPLKSIQGKIWRSGYLDGTLQGELFDDVHAAFEKWKSLKIAIYIFSSGSVQAQQLLFKYSNQGDLTKFIDGYFDTRIGSKIEAESYHKITNEINCQPSETLFISDSATELQAASEAGLEVLWSRRPGNKAEEANFKQITDLLFFE